MEAMRGPKWKARMAQENKGFMDELGAIAKEPEIDATAARFEANSNESERILTFDVTVGSSKIQVIEEGSILKWRWDGSKKLTSMVADLDMAENMVVYSKDLKGGAHHYNIYAVSKEKLLWSFDGRGQHGLSSDVAILGDRVYCLEASGPLQYKWLVSVNLETGHDRRVHYEEHDPSVSIGLIRAENKCLFLLADNAGKQALYHIGLKGGIKRLDKEATVFFPVGYGPKGGDPCYFFRKDFSSPWVARGAALKAMTLPTGISGHGLDLVNLREGVIIHRAHGERYADKGARRLMSFWGEIQENAWSHWNGADADLRLFVPGQTAVKGTFKDSLFFEKPATVYGASLKNGMAKSADGTQVRWLVVASEKKPLGLLVVGYGAYNLTTPTDTTRWRLYIEAGFAIGFAFIRGGGDHNDAWAAAGRIEGKERGIEDFEACVRALQGVTGVGADHTCIFGRSAGGYLMGLAVMRSPRGELARYVYTEAPYVDVLQTSTNEKLPLTAFEYCEFGDPAHKIADFEMMLRLSPVGATGSEGAPGVFVLCRVGLNDSQVYAYESVKWMDVLRGTINGEKKILFLTKGVGHSVHGKEVSTERAQDFLILRNKVLSVNR